MKDIVFDVGRVLIDFSYDALFAFFREQGVVLNRIDDFAEKLDLKSYEYGRISSDEFIHNLSGLFLNPPDDRVLITKWTEIFSPMMEMLEFASELKKDHRVFLLSNTSALHWTYLLDEYNLKERSSGVLASFEVGAMKPEAKIFREAERRFDLSPENTVFIDDIKENALGAVSCGWHAIHHVGVGETKRKLRTWLSI